MVNLIARWQIGLSKISNLKLLLGCSSTPLAKHGPTEGMYQHHVWRTLSLFEGGYSTYQMTQSKAAVPGQRYAAFEQKMQRQLMRMPANRVFAERQKDFEKRKEL